MRHDVSEVMSLPKKPRLDWIPGSVTCLIHTNFVRRDTLHSICCSVKGVYSLYFVCRKSFLQFCHLVANMAWFHGMDRHLKMCAVLFRIGFWVALISSWCVCYLGWEALCHVSKVMGTAYFRFLFIFYSNNLFASREGAGGTQGGSFWSYLILRYMEDVVKGVPCLIL